MSEQFEKDLKFGEKYEDVVIDFLCKHHNSKLIEKRMDYKYDFALENKFFRTITFELKTDRMMHKTGNIAIEFESRCKPSGIFKTVADYFLIYCPVNKLLYMSERDFLLWYLQDSKPIVVSGGDNNSSKLFLKKVSELECGFSKYTIK